VNARILLVEDDASLGETLAERLQREGHTVKWARTLREARAALDAGPWHLAILDVMLPDGSGFALAGDVRGRSVAPVMFMTALNSAESRLQGFEQGAEEYLPKPFHLKEFLMRVRHVLQAHPPRGVLVVGGLSIDWDALAVDAPGRPRAFLQTRDCRVLRLLVEAAPRAMDRSEILDRAWGEDKFPTPRAVDNAIVRLREALGDSDGTLIRSVRGIGYQWAAESQS
jgi:DNA-binding response OmpR family regulator